jgi:hypothetical protein
MYVTPTLASIKPLEIFRGLPTLITSIDNFKQRFTSPDYLTVARACHITVTGVENTIKTV